MVTFYTARVNVRNLRILPTLFFFNNFHNTYYFGPGSSVGIATGYVFDGPGIKSRWGGEIFPHLSRPALEPTQPPVQWLLGLSPGWGVKSERGVKLTPHPLLVSWPRKSRAIPLVPLWAVRPVQSFSACTRVHFNFCLYILFPCLYNGGRLYFPEAKN